MMPLKPITCDRRRCWALLDCCQHWRRSSYKCAAARISVRHDRQRRKL